ncbi:MAG TPA: M48 family metallopeptidase [bacterium]|nr:M48 family metallopeptidase [bacterium]
MVHELCHLKVQNHSSSFWKLVSSALPDYSQSRDWLRHNVHALRL